MINNLKVLKLENYYNYQECDFEDCKKEFAEYNKELAKSILKLKNLEELGINDFDSKTLFIDIILENYKSDNLVKFESNCIKYSSAKKFLLNNKNLKIISFKNE